MLRARLKLKGRGKLFGRRLQYCGRSDKATVPTAKATQAVVICCRLCDIDRRHPAARPTSADCNWRSEQSLVAKGTRCQRKPTRASARPSRPTSADCHWRSELSFVAKGTRCYWPLLGRPRLHVQSSPQFSLGPPASNPAARQATRALRARSARVRVRIIAKICRSHMCVSGPSRRLNDHPVAQARTKLRRTAAHCAMRKWDTHVCHLDINQERY